MDENKEKAFLENILSDVELEKRSVLTRWWFNILLWIVSTIIFVFLLRAHEQGLINTLTLLIVSSVVGVAVGVVIIIQSSDKNWKFLRQHINKGSVKLRIEELDT